MKTIKLIAVTILIILFLVSCASTPQKMFQEQYELGLRYLSEGNYEEAIIAFMAAIEIDPKNVDAYLALANVYAEEGNYEEAIITFLTAIEIDPENEDAYLSLSHVYTEQGDFEKTAEILHEGAELTNNLVLKEEKSAAIYLQTNETLQNLINKGIYIQEELPALINYDYIEMLTKGNGAIKKYFEQKDYTFTHWLDLSSTGLISATYYRNPYNRGEFNDTYLNYSFVDKGESDFTKLIEEGQIGDATTYYNGYPDDWSVNSISVRSNTVFKDTFPFMQDELANGNIIENLDVYLQTSPEITHSPTEFNAGSTSIGRTSYKYTLNEYILTVVYSDAEYLPNTPPSITIEFK